MKHFPDINEIKLLEKNSQKKGSGIVYEELLGICKFKYVWGKESDEIKNIPSSILQVLSARLELRSKNKEDKINYEIKLLEKNSQKNGSGILHEELVGGWKFKYVWGKESDEIKNIPSSILQVLSARLELKSKNNEDQINYEIKNSINFGLLNITFLGSAELKGIRPILAFYFEELKIGISSFPIFNKQLKKPEDKKMPFFSLVGISTKDNWLCARGRGGGLAIWVKS